MPPLEREERQLTLEAEVAGLSTRVDTINESLEKNNVATAAIGEQVARLRGEINGHLPRIEDSVARIHQRLDVYRDEVATVRERSKIHENEIGTVLGALASKADAKANDEAHTRLWLFLQISLFAIAAGAIGVLLAKASSF
jgi:chromosome segregation ATPase